MSESVTQTVRSSLHLMAAVIVRIIMFGMKIRDNACLVSVRKSSSPTKKADTIWMLTAATVWKGTFGTPKSLTVSSKSVTNWKITIFKTKKNTACMSATVKLVSSGLKYTPSAFETAPSSKNLSENSENPAPSTSVSARKNISGTTMKRNAVCSAEASSERKTRLMWVKIGACACQASYIMLKISV